MYCRHCGAVIPENAAFCNECGQKVSRLDVFRYRAGSGLADPKSKVILVMGIVIVVLMIMLIVK